MDWWRDEDEVWKRVERRLRAPVPSGVRDSFWTRQQWGNEFAECACEADAEALMSQLAELIEPILGDVNQGRRGPSSPRDKLVARQERSLIARERLRDEARAAYLARQPQIQRFRELVLGGKLLSSPAAEFALAIQAEPDGAWQRLSAAFCHRNRVTAFSRAQERRRPSGTRVMVVEIQDVEWSDRGPNAVVVETLELPLAILDLPPLFDEEHLETRPVWDWLRVLIDDVSDFMFWGFSEAARWLLSGDLPDPSPYVRFRITRGPAIQLIVRPGVPPKEVERAYRSVLASSAAQLFAGSLQPHRPLSSRGLALARFYLELWQAGRWQSYRKAFAEWNRAHPEARYRSFGNFERDLRRAVRSVFDTLPGNDPGQPDANLLWARRRPRLERAD